MRGLTKEQKARKAELEEALTNAVGLVQHAHGELVDAVNGYNDVVVEINEWREEIETDGQAFIDDRSDRWQESDRGTAVQAFVDEYSNPVDELEQPEEPELAENLDEYPEEIDG